MHIVTPICIFFVRRAVRSSLCVIPTRRPASARFKPSLYHSKVNVASSILLLSSLYAHFAAKPRRKSGALLLLDKRGAHYYNKINKQLAYANSKNGGQTMNDEELEFDRSCHVLYSAPCKAQILEKIALHYPQVSARRTSAAT